MSVVIRAGKWTVRLCAGCNSPRMMPVCEIVCRRYEPGGGPRSYRLLGLWKRLLEEPSVETLIERVGISAATIRRAERCRRVHAETAVRLAEALGTSVRELAHGDVEQAETAGRWSGGIGLPLLMRQAMRGGEKGC